MGSYMIVITLSSLPKSFLKEKYSFTAGSFWENKCSIEKSIVSLGINKVNTIVNPRIPLSVIFGLSMILPKTFSIICFLYLLP